MNNRERILSVLRYQAYDRLPIVHFGYWGETLAKWAAEGHLTKEEARGWGDGNPTDFSIAKKLGFDSAYFCTFSPHSFMKPGFEGKLIKEFPDGTRHVLNGNGVVVQLSPNSQGIPAEIDHLLKGRKEWEELYKPKFQYADHRVNEAMVNVGDKMLRYDQGGKEFLQKGERDFIYGLQVGSLFGNIRNILGVIGSSYLYADDEVLYTEIIDTVGELCYQCVKKVLDDGCKFDYAHYWEDICFKSGPLVIPYVFDEKVGPHYKRINDLVRSHGIDIISLDCDGVIDALIPTWFNNGVNTMFPIEVGTWGAEIKPWREKYGKGLLGVGGMNKVVFAHDHAAIDAEVERLKPLVELGGYIPCPDHRIPPDAKWENVQYYCEKMHKIFS